MCEYTSPSQLQQGNKQDIRKDLIKLPSKSYISVRGEIKDTHAQLICFISLDLNFSFIPALKILATFIHESEYTK